MFSSVIEFLLGMRNIRISDVGSAHFAFQMQNLWWALPAVVILAVLGFLSYRHVPAVKKWRYLAGALRALTLALLLVLFLRPSLVLDRQAMTRSVVAVWVDDSLSMTLRDPYSRDLPMQGYLKTISATTQAATQSGTSRRPTRYELTERIMSAGWAQQIAPQQDIALFTGSTSAQPIGIAHKPEDIAALLARLPAYAPGQSGAERGSEGTDVPTVVRDMLARLRGQPVSAVVLLTDGRSTIPGRLDAAIDVARQSSVQAYAIALGQPDTPLNIKLVNLHAPENAFSRDPVAVRATLETSGLPGEMPVRLKLTRRDTGETLAEKTVTASPQDESQPVELIFKPAGKGEQIDRMELSLTAEPIAAIGDELTQEDNTLTTSLSVVDAKITALYVEGYPRWEYRYLKNELIREKTVDASILLLSADDDFAQEGDIAITRFPETEEELNKYDVLIMGDVDPNYFSPAQQKLIVDWVKNRGGGVAFVAGRQFNPNAYRGTTFEPLLPVVPDDPANPSLASSDAGGFHLQMTLAGKTSNLFRFFDDPDANERQMEENPELYWYRPVLGLKGSAEVLAVHPTRTLGGQPTPLLVAGRYGAGRTLYSAIADTWRWRRYKGEPLYQTYWLQVCRMLYAEKAFGQAHPIEIAAENPQVELGEPIRISATVRNTAQMAGLPQTLVLEVTDASGKPVEPITLTRSGENSYQGLATASRLGKFTAKIAAGTLGMDLMPIQFSVIAPRRETADLTADFASLNNLTTATGGRLLRPYESQDLPTLIPNRSIQTYVPVVEELWPKPLALLLILTFVFIEWFVRKKASLP